MKKFLRFLMYLLLVFLLIAVAYTIREFLLVEQNSIYSFTQLYKKNDFNNIKSEFPTIIIIDSENHNMSVGTVSYDGGDTKELLFMGKEGSDKFESIIYYSDHVCNREKALDPELFREIGVPITPKLNIFKSSFLSAFSSIIGSNMLTTYYSDKNNETNYSDFYTIYYQPLFSKYMYSMNCILDNDEEESNIFFEMMSIEDFSKTFNINNNNLWDELKALEYKGNQ